MGYQNCLLRVQGHFLRKFFHRVILIDTVNGKFQLVLSKLHFIFAGNFWAKQLFFLVLARLFKHGLPKLYSTCPEAFLRKFFHRIILTGTVSEKNQLVLSKLHSIFAGNFWAKQFSKSLIWFFLVLARFFKHGLPKLYSTCPEAFLRNFFHRIILTGTVSEKKSAGFVKTAFYFSGELFSKTILEVVDLVFSSPWQIFQAWVTKTVFYVSRGTFCGIFFTESY